MGSRLDEFFRWKVGDLVTLRQGLYTFGANLERQRGTVVILERILIECSGGAQPYYGIRLFRAEGHASVIERFHELELMDLPADGAA